MPQADGTWGFCRYRYDGRHVVHRSDTGPFGPVRSIRHSHPSPWPSSGARQGRGIRGCPDRWIKQQAPARSPRRGLPHDRRGYALLAGRAPDGLGAGAQMPQPARGLPRRGGPGGCGQAHTCTGTRECVVIPRAVGTLVSCGRRGGTVINIGHGTTEIMNIQSGGVDGVSLEKATDLVVSQISRRTDKGAYVGYAGLFEARLLPCAGWCPCLPPTQPAGRRAWECMTRRCWSEAARRCPAWGGGRSVPP